MDRSGATILLVDDDEDLVESVALLLEEAGYSVTTAPHGGAALELARARRFDAVVLDMMMPVVDGLDFLARFEREVGRPPPPVLACSGFDAFEALALERGARAFLRKPYSAEVLLASLARLLVGLPPTPATREANRLTSGRDRADAAARREAVLASAALDEGAREDARQLVKWAAGYFGAAKSFVTLLYSDGIHILAACGAEDWQGEGIVVNPTNTFCTDVIAAGTCLFLSNAPAHPAFKSRKPARFSPFYAGAPLITEDGLALGVLCIEDFVELEFGAEDLALLGHFGVLLGKRIVTIPDAAPAAHGRIFVAPGVFGAEASDVLLEAELRRAERDGTALELLTMRLRDRSAESLALLAEGIFARTGRRRAVMFQDAEGLASLLIGGASPELVKARTDAVLYSELCERLTALGCVSFAGRRRAPLPVSDLRREARDALASFCSGRIERRELAGEPLPRAS